MEKLLDKHLPVEKDNRRRIIFLLLFLLLGGLGVYLGISKPWQQKRATTGTSNGSAPINEKTNASSVGNPTKEKNSEPGATALSTKTEVRQPAEKAALVPEENKPAHKVAETKKTTSSILETNEEEKQTKETVISKYSIEKGTNKPDLNKYLSTSKIANQKQLKNKIVPIQDNTKGNEPKNEFPVVNDNIATAITKNLTTVGTGKIAEKIETIDVTDRAVIANNDPVSKTKTTEITRSDSLRKKEEPVAQKSNTRPNPGRQKKSAFAITLSAGPDLSAVGVSRIGAVRPVYGAGLSYTFNRITIRTGFFVARKIYTAGKNDYHASGYVWPPNIITKVDGDCRLYEIPLTFAYTISSSKNQNWFASVGASSFLMKKENYNYYYKNLTTGQDWSKDWTLKNGENHIFSILDLSAGYERKLNKRLSLIAEPYLKIPMDGIGFGKINLNSAGMLFTLSIKPFAGK
ncbi:MAG: hypothetical protein JST09_06890 [Bacteroidetes bacterium]|nr:hypothetical protein [Bacteroidota bacterium]